MFSLLALALSFSAHAYQDKTYECRNVDHLPANTYKITTVELAPGIKAPYLEIRRHFRQKTGDVNSQLITAEMKGLATISTTAPGRYAFLIGALRLEFDGDTLLNCRP